MQTNRNSLGAAYVAAEGLYDNGVALSQLLEVWSRRDRAPVLTAEARAYVAHNLLNAQANLDGLRQALAEFMDVEGESGEATPDLTDQPGDLRWPANDGSDDGSVGKSGAMPARARLGRRSGISGSAGGIL